MHGQQLALCLLVPYGITSRTRGSSKVQYRKGAVWVCLLGCESIGQIRGRSAPFGNKLWDNQVKPTRSTRTSSPAEGRGNETVVQLFLFAVSSNGSRRTYPCWCAVPPWVCRTAHSGWRWLQQRFLRDPGRGRSGASSQVLAPSRLRLTFFRLSLPHEEETDRAEPLKNMPCLAKKAKQRQPFWPGGSHLHSFASTLVFATPNYSSCGPKTTRSAPRPLFRPRLLLLLLARKDSGRVHTSRTYGPHAPAVDLKRRDLHRNSVGVVELPLIDQQSGVGGAVTKRAWGHAHDGSDDTQR